MSVSADGYQIISAPVSIADVNSLLSCGNDLGIACLSNRINKWAKYRPFLANRNVPFNPSTGEYNPSGDESSPHRVWYLGLRNGNMNNSPDPDDPFFNEAVSVNFYGSAGADEAMEKNYRYDASSALFTSLTNSPTKTRFSTVTNSISNLIWNFGGSQLVNSKIYRLTDFNGYCHKAGPAENVFFSPYIYMGGSSADSGELQIVFDSLASTNPIKQYCLSCSNLFTNSGNSFNQWFFGILFTKHNSTGDSLLINTGAYAGRTAALGDGVLSISGNTIGIGTLNTSYNTPLYYGNYNGTVQYSTSYSGATLYWVFSQHSQGKVILLLFMRNIPGASSFFSGGTTYTVQVVLANGGVPAGSAATVKTESFTTPVSGVSNMYYTADDIYSLELSEAWARIELTAINRSRSASETMLYSSSGMSMPIS